jgi:hypothetical protein
LLLTSATKVILEVSILFKEKCFWSSTRAINTKIGKNGRYTIFNDGGDIHGIITCMTGILRYRFLNRVIKIWDE